MPRDPRVDAYIAKSADFAEPILKRIRAAVHKAVPRVTETIKWNVPCYEDDRGIICLTPAFKRHCAWVFWTGRKPKVVNAMTLRRMTAVSDLPAQPTLVKMVKEAASQGKTPAAMTKASKKTAKAKTTR